MNRKIIFALLIFITALGLMNVAFAHEAEYPEPYIDNPKINSVVSGDVDFNVSVDDHHETLYVNVTATHRETNTVYFHNQDNNPSDGWSCTWDTSDAPNGKYYVSAVAMNSKDLKGQYNILITLNNTKKETNIILDSSVGVVDEENTIMAHLVDAEQKALSGKNVEFTVDGETQPATTTSEGVAMIKFTPKEARDYNVSVKFDGDNIYAPSQESMVLNVLANSTLVTITNVTGNNKEKILLSANLKNYLGLNAGKEIDFYINGEKVGSAVTDENGDANLEYTISQVGGNYIYSAEYYDNVSNKTFKALSTFFVPESSIYVKINAVTYSKDGIFTVGNKFKVTYTVFNDGPNSAENVTFNYAVPNSLKYISNSPSQGTAKFENNEIAWDIGTLDIGNQTLEVEFEALKAAQNNLAPSVSTATYDKSVGNNISRNTLTVKSYKLVASDLTKYYTANGKLNIYVKDSKGNVVSGAVVHVVFNKQKIDLKTNSKGYVSLDAKNLAVGKYTIKATCNALSISKKITVKPLLVTKNLSKKKAKTIKFTAKLLNNKGKILKNKKVTFKFKGKAYSAKTNSKGIATLSLKNLKVGKYTIQTSYGKSTVKNTITIKK